MDTEDMHDCLCDAQYMCLCCREECLCESIPRHADYPHNPGTLYDCPACESGCCCTDDISCLYCASFEYEKSA
jgi:hypothetical protein